MRIRTVVTKSFHKEMNDNFGLEQDSSGIYLICVDNNQQSEAVFCRKLANVMKRAILSSNSILKNSKRLTDTIEKIVFIGQSEKIERGILDFFFDTDDINLDGYIYFVLNEYTEKINTILYRVVRNNIKWLKINE